jgi:hypothetical protein
MKEVYQTPAMEVLLLDNQDVIITSGEGEMEGGEF